MALCMIRSELRHEQVGVIFGRFRIAGMISKYETANRVPWGVFVYLTFYGVCSDAIFVARIVFS